MEGGTRRHYRRGQRQASGASDERLLSGEWKRWGRGRAAALPEGATVGGAGEGDSWCDRRGEHCSYGRGERRSYRRVGRRCCRRGRAPALPEGAIAGVTGGGQH